MTPERWQQVEKLFKEALEFKPEERGSFLDQACAGDVGLRDQVIALLRSDEAANSFLESPAFAGTSGEHKAGGAGHYVGRSFGPYLVKNHIGSGGMGEVYLAEDTRLGRNIALKFLAPGRLNDSQFRARFLREARAVSRLNHPHICVLHDVGNHDGIDFLIMEYVEGKTLADRLKRGPLPLDQALRCAIEISDALDTAHRQGITHRDLKPANIMLTKSGAKLLDFGLAKTESRDLSAQDSTAPTDLTATGIVLGTLPYMAPEQLEGKGADARTDIFAFGAVLYEMITGRKPFDGETRSRLMAAILERDPTPMASPGRLISAALERLVKICLAKGPEDRWQTARDLCRELKWIADSATAVAPDGTSHSRVRTKWFPAVVVAIAAALVLLSAAIYFRGGPSTASAIRFEMPVTGIIGAPVISPNGQRIAYIASSDGRSTIWIHPVGAVAARPLAGCENAEGSPFWSPDSRYLGFFADGKLKKIDVSGGFVTILRDYPYSWAAAWNRDGDILISSVQSPGLSRISDAGGELTPITVPDRSGRPFHGFPQFLPDGRRFLYHFFGGAGEEAIVYIGSLDSKSTTRLASLPDFSSFIDVGMKYANGYLLFRRVKTLMAQPFDVNRQTAAGEPMPLVENVRSGFSVSENGVLVYQQAADQPVPQSNVQLLWFDRKGQQTGQVAAPPFTNTVELSPNGKRVAIDTNGSGDALSDVWVIELASGVATKLHADNPYWDGYPIWNADGSRVIFSSGRAGQPLLIHEEASNASGTAELFPYNQGAAGEPRDQLDTRYLIFDRWDSTLTTVGLWVLPLAGDRKPVPFLPVGSVSRHQGQFSPNGKYLAYVTDESGTMQIVVQTFPDSSKGKWQVTATGGTEPRWRGDGRELFYLDSQGKLVALSVKTEPTFEAGERTALFQVASAFALPGAWPRHYDVTADGQRFLVVPPPAAANSTPITAVVNWTALLRKK